MGGKDIVFRAYVPRQQARGYSSEWGSAVEVEGIFYNDHDENWSGR